MQALWGPQVSPKVAKISDAYAERKVNFAKDIQLVLQKSESATQAVLTGMAHMAHVFSPT